MTQEERWMSRYNEVVSFIETNHRNMFWKKTSRLFSKKGAKAYK